jgi:hypothetical protein
MNFDNNGFDDGFSIFNFAFRSWQFLEYLALIHEKVMVLKNNMTLFKIIICDKSSKAYK